jgi:acyl carrier protein
VDIERKIERFQLDEIMFGSRTSTNPDESLVMSGMIDSLALLRLVTHLEKQFGVRFEDRFAIPAKKTPVESKLR